MRREALTVLVFARKESIGGKKILRGGGWWPDLVCVGVRVGKISGILYQTLEGRRATPSQVWRRVPSHEPFRGNCLPLRWATAEGGEKDRGAWREESDKQRKVRNAESVEAADRVAKAESS